MFKKTMLVGAAASAMVLCAPAMAQAAPPYTVSVGGSSATADHSFTASSVGAITFTVPLDTMTCTSADASGKVHSGTGMSGAYTPPSPPWNNPATISGSTWTGCSEQFGTPLQVTQNGDWQLEVDDPSVTSAQTDVVQGDITHIDAHVQDMIGGAVCDFEVTGSANASFDEAKQQLDVNETGDGSLIVSAVTQNCLGFVSVGDVATFKGTYNISVPDGAVNIS
ncbi:MAG: hypothetical protein FWE71_07510 [Nocardioidaceae bacterium]|nr:hypothetical protein [Nocardioidaceae bacterium]MCL2611835.1 hypothetical protein [Nocardioidaceae bacterium]